jgi:hypothetical protein
MMTDAITTASAAASSPTPPGPLTQMQPEPTRHDGSQRSGVISDAAYDALPTEVDRDRYSRVRKGPDGGSEWRERSTLQSSTDPAAKPAAGDTSLALVPDQKYLFGDLELKGQEILDLLKFKGETELRRAAVPADPSQYKIEAKDAVLPPGMEWQFKEDDPALAAARTWAHANGLSQDQFGSLLGQYASMEAAKEATYRNAMKRELDALGANATMRVTALEMWLNGMVGPEIAKHMRQGLFSAKIVEGLEVIAKKFTTQGHASFTQHGRTPQDTQPGRVSEAEYDAMSQSERYRYAKSFDQKQFRS